jgi:hypothetical protein
MLLLHRGIFGCAGATGAVIARFMVNPLQGSIMNQTSNTPQPPDLAQPTPAKHNDDQRSHMPERDDKARKQSPADKPGKTPGEGETPVG